MNGSLNNKKICFLGAGSIAEAIIHGLIDNKQAHADHIFVVNRHNQNRLQELHKRYGIQVHPERKMKNKFLQEADIIVLAMKPSDVVEALHVLQPLLNEKQLLISVVAGLSITTMYDIIKLPLPIVRSMPNTSSSIGLGATGVSFSEHVREEHQTLALTIFQSIGIVSVVEEAKINVVTGLSGSGPAYIYYMIEAMIEAGVEGGLSEEQAKQLTIQTVLGAASMVSATNEQPAILRRKVTSPGGSTQAAIDVLEQNEFSKIVKQAVKRAAERATEMGAAIK